MEASVSVSHMTMAYLLTWLSVMLAVICKLFQSGFSMDFYFNKWQFYVSINVKAVV